MRDVDRCGFLKPFSSQAISFKDQPTVPHIRVDINQPFLLLDSFAVVLLYFVFFEMLLNVICLILFDVIWK